MSSKSVEAPRGARSWSLTARLTRHYIVSTTLLLAAAAGFLHWTLERGLDARDRAQVLSKVQVLQLLLREHHDKPEVIASEVEHEAGESQAMRYYLRILDEQGRTVIETKGMQDLLPPGVFPLATPEVATQEIGGGGVLGKHATYLLATVETETGTGTGRKRRLQVALDLTPHRELSAEYRQTLLAMLVIGIVLTSLAGAGIVRHGIRPLTQVAEKTRQITASRLSERVSSQEWPEELRLLANSFDEMLVRLESSFRRLSDFSADIAHALRNPINNLRGEAEVTLARVRTPQEYQQVLGSSLEELERLSRMIDNLLFIARADDPSVALDRTSFPARPELEAVKEFYEAVAAEAGVAVDCEGDAPMSGDPMLVRRAVSNLLGNALKHTAAGGRVVVAARLPEGGGVEISVRDTGAGIPRDLLPNVFDRFFQVEKSRDLTAKGAGLGLAIVQSIMRLHGGRAAIESTVGAGTTVRLWFPPGPADRKT